MLLLSKENYSLYGSYIDRDYIKDQYKELHYLYTVLDKVHAAHPNDIGLQDLQAFFFQTYPDADKEVYLALFKTLSETTLTPDVGVALMKDIKARKQALILSEAAFKFSNGTGDAEKIIDAYEDFGVDDETPEFEFVTTDVEKLLNETVDSPGLPFRLNFLSKSLGELRKGNFGFLFARPETGKTTFLASEVSYMLTKLKDGDGPVLWLNNEQPGGEVMLRMVQAFFGVQLDTLMANRRKYNSEFNRLVGERFRLVDDANIHRAQVEKLLKYLKPSLVIYDQIDKVKGFTSDREDLRLGNIYIWARELAKEYCPAIGVCQADGNAEGQKWLTMDHVANAKTSKQAEADWILGIGKVHAPEFEHTRYLNISKNKLLGTSETLASLRHGRTEVLIDPQIARYKDIVKYN